MKDFARKSSSLFSNGKVSIGIWIAVSGTELKIQISLGDFCKKSDNDQRTSKKPVNLLLLPPPKKKKHHKKTTKPALT